MTEVKTEPMESTGVKNSIVQETNDQGSDAMSDAYVSVCGREGEEAIELPLESDGSLTLETLQIEFAGALGVKYRNPNTGLLRVLKPDEHGVLRPPSGGWPTSIIACIPREAQKRMWQPNDEDHNEPNATSAEPPCKKAYFTPLTTNETTASIGATDTSTDSSTGEPTSPSKPSAAAKGMPGKIFESCDICKVSMNSKTQADLHYAGKKHQDRAAGRIAVAASATAAPSSDSIGFRGGMMRGGGTRGGFRGRGRGRAGLMVPPAMGMASHQPRWPPPRFMHPQQPPMNFAMDPSPYGPYGSFVPPAPPSQ